MKKNDRKLKSLNVITSTEEAEKMQENRSRASGLVGKVSVCNFWAISDRNLLLLNCNSNQIKRFFVAL